MCTVLLRASQALGALGEHSTAGLSGGKMSTIKRKTSVSVEIMLEIDSLAPIKSSKGL